jgi:hypothetical protein
MYFGLAAVSDENIEAILRYPPLVWKVVAPDDPEPFEQECASWKKPSFIGRLFGGKPQESPAAFPVQEEFFDGALDKAWHGVHYLLTGSSEAGDPPLNFICSGGKEAGNIEVGYGTARVFRSHEVQAIAAALARVSDEELRRRFNPKEMLKLKIYPQIWHSDPEDDDPLGYLMENVDGLRMFLDRAVTNRRGMVVYLS